MIYDISMELHDNIPVYGDNPIKKVSITRDFEYSKHGFEEAHLNMNLHNGTHIDAPRHMIDQGTTTDAIKLEKFYSKAVVIDLMHVKEVISAKDIESFELPEDHFILFKTTNSLENDLFNPHFVFVGADAARVLAKAKVRGVGVDGLGIERDQEGHPTHVTLMNKDIIILEGLRLAHVPSGHYTLIAFPLSIRGVDAAPVRAVLID